MSDTDAESRIERRMNRADLITGCVFVILGLIIAYLSWIMPRLEMRGIHPATVPGLVPGLLGGALAICGLALAGRAVREGRGRDGWRDLFSIVRERETGRLAIATVLALVYPLVLVGLVPFWLASALFVFAFILIFETWASPAPKPVLRSAVLAAIQGIIVGVAVTLVFQYGFLVRLP